MADDQDPVEVSGLALKCLVADRSAIFALGLEAALGSNHVKIVGCVDDPAGVKEFVAREPVDVVLSCFEPAIDAVTVARAVDDCPVLVLSTQVADDLVFEAFRAGVRGVLTKNATRDELIAAVTRVANGETVLPVGWERRLPRFMETTARERGTGTALTLREGQIVDRLVLGHSNKQVARDLGIAEQTVKNHVRHLMAKVGVSSRVQLCRWALQQPRFSDQ